MATGFTGSAEVYACSQQLPGPYLLRNCMPLSNYCDAVEPDLTGANMEPLAPGMCDGTAAGALCAHSCLPGHSGGAVACAGSGSGPTFVVTPCAPFACCWRSMSARTPRSRVLTTPPKTVAQRAHTYAVKEAGTHDWKRT